MSYPQRILEGAEEPANRPAAHVEYTYTPERERARRAFVKAKGLRHLSWSNWQAMCLVLLPDQIEQLAPEGTLVWMCNEGSLRRMGYDAADGFFTCVWRIPEGTHPRQAVLRVRDEQTGEVGAPLDNQPRRGWYTLREICAARQEGYEVEIVQGAIWFRKHRGAAENYGRGWQAARRRIMRRAGSVCERCHREPAKHVHHIKSLQTFEQVEDGHADRNLLALCPQCHFVVHNEADYRQACAEVGPLQAAILFPKTAALLVAEQG